MKLLSRIGSLILPLAGVLAFASCQYEKEILDAPQPLPDGDSAEISFMAQIPEASVIQTRTDTEPGTVDENRIDNIYVLVFETAGSQNLVYRGKGKIQSFSGTNQNTVKFSATLPVGTAYDFMVLANAEALLNTNSIVITTGTAKTKADVEAILQNAVTASSVYQPWSDPIPMWDDQVMTLSTSNPDSNSKVFNLMRMMARVQVSYEPVSPDNSFKLTQVRYYNYNTAGKLVPDATKLAFLNPSDPNDKRRLVTGVSLPANPNTQLEKYFEYTATNNASKNQIYVFEAANQGKYEGELPANAANWIKNPCLLVKGIYDVNKNGSFDDAETWYRIDFVRNANETNEEWLSILRNFTYNVVITSVSGQGYPDPDVALKSAPMNLTAGVMDWNDGDMDLIYFDGTAYLSVDKNDFRFERDAVNTKLADESNVLRIRTDYTVNGYPQNSGWHAEYFEKDGVTPMTDANRWLWLQNPDEGLTDKGSPTGAPNEDPAVTHFTFTQNTGTENREACVYIVAGRLRYRIRVIQRLLSLKILDKPSTAGGVPVTEFFEVVPRASKSDGTRDEVDHTFVVEWEPIADDVTTGNESPLAFNPFWPEWITGTPANTLPAPGLSGSITQNTGTQTYTAHFPGKTNEELSDTNDPFYERESTYTFKIDNGLDPSSPSYDYVEKSVTLHQIYYNIIVDVSKYRLDGSTHTLTVRSNTEWEITKIEEWLYNVNPDELDPADRPTEPVMLRLKPYDNLREGTTGGHNVNGEAIAFTVVNNEGGDHDGKWGTVYVTFHSPTGKFPDRRVALPFPAASRLILAMGYHDGAYATNAGINTPYHKNSANQMLSSPYNFGSMDESIYQVEGLRIVGYQAAGESSTSSTPSATYPDFAWYKYSLSNWLNDHNPDVLVLTSYPYIASAIRLNTNEKRLLNEFLINGGAVILCNIGPDGTSYEYLAHLMESLATLPPDPTHPEIPGATVSYTHGAATSTSTYDVKTHTGTGAYFKFENIEDPILSGPFGRLQDKYWGSHYYHGGIKTSLIQEWAIPLSKGIDYSGEDNYNGDYTTIFRHKKYNLVWVGNESFIGSNNPQLLVPQYCPFLLDPNNFYKPIDRPNYGRSAAAADPKVSVSNSIFFANAMAWALSVTNHTPPAGGYETK